MEAIEALCADQAEQVPREDYWHAELSSRRGTGVTSYHRDPSISKGSVVHYFTAAANVHL